jgi:hypothetical protein
MGGSVTPREITWGGERRYFLPVSYRERGARQASPFVDYTSIKSESDAEYAAMGAGVDDTSTVGGSVNVGVDLGTLSALGAAGPFVLGGILTGAGAATATDAAKDAGKAAAAAAKALAQAADKGQRQIDTALIIGGVLAVALLVFAVRR